MSLLISIDSYAADIQFATCLDDSAGDFASVRNQDFAEHGTTIISQWSLCDEQWLAKGECVAICQTFAVSDFRHRVVFWVGAAAPSQS
jgi:hypothetical protein